MPQPQDDQDLAAGFAASQAKYANDPEIIAERGRAKGDEEPWEERYKSINGKYLKEVPELQKTAKELAARNAELEVQLAALRKPAPAAETADTPEVAAFREEYPTHAKVIDVVAKQAAEEAVGTIKQEVDSVEKKLEKQARDAHFMAISAAHRDWKERLPEINVWASGLASEDERKRAEAVLNSGTALEVVDLYTRFKEETGISRKPPEPPLSGVASGSTPIASGLVDDSSDFAAGYRMSTQRK